MRIQTSGPWYEIHADSVADYCDTKPHPKNADKLDESLAEGNREGAAWFGASSHAEVRRLIAQGWPEGRERALKALSALTPTAPISKRRRRVQGDQGDTIDMTRVWRGQLDTAWTRCARRDVSAPLTVRIAVSVANLSGTHSETFFWTGAAVLAATDALTAAGYNVEVLAVMQTTNVYVSAEARHSRHYVTVKPATAPLDLDTLASAVCLAGFMRVFGFQARAARDAKVAYGWGASFQGSLEGVVNCNHNMVRDRASAQQWLDTTLAQFN